MLTRVINTVYLSLISLAIKHHEDIKNVTFTFKNHTKGKLNCIISVLLQVEKNMDYEQGDMPDKSGRKWL